MDCLLYSAGLGIAVETETPPNRKLLEDTSHLKRWFLSFDYEVGRSTVQSREDLCRTVTPRPII
jgi:hypothetical protein